MNEFINGKLTTKQKRFIEEYCVDFNATQAAIRAGYNPNSANRIGSENLSKPDISKAILARLDELSMKSEEAIKRLTEMGRGSFASFLTFAQDGKVSIDLSSSQAQGNLHLIKKIKQTVRKTINDGKAVETVIFEVELHDSKDALKTILEVHRKIGVSPDTNLEVIIEA
ncbi:MAG: terminase small subunit [Spirosomataceae bacterium]